MSHLRVVRDAQVERAVLAMTKAPARRWTVGELAKIAGLSRAAFARRFRADRGVAPSRWLAEHRLQIARTWLLETDATLARIATAVGYNCEFAFAKAFKRLTGLAPGLFRQTTRPATPAFRAAA